MRFRKARTYLDLRGSRKSWRWKSIDSNLSSKCILMDAEGQEITNTFGKYATNLFLGECLSYARRTRRLYNSFKRLDRSSRREKEERDWMSSCSWWIRRGILWISYRRPHTTSSPVSEMSKIMTLNTPTWINTTRKWDWTRKNGPIHYRLGTLKKLIRE